MGIGLGGKLGDAGFKIAEPRSQRYGCQWLRRVAEKNYFQPGGIYLAITSEKRQACLPW
jgi:hypothetical protein